MDDAMCSMDVNTGVAVHGGRSPTVGDVHDGTNVFTPIAVAFRVNIDI